MHLGNMNAPTMTKQKVLPQGIHVKYESSMTYHSKVMANAKDF